MKKHYTIKTIKIYGKVMYLVNITWCDALVGENLFSHKIDAEAWVEHMRQLDAQDR